MTVTGNKIHGRKEKGVRCMEENIEICCEINVIGKSRNQV
jgi:hypothetical protein